MSLAGTEVLPSARRLIGSLRDVGYDLAVSLADLVDNSISAHASTIQVDLVFDGPESWIRVADDGCGMLPSQLAEAMRFGSRRDYAPRELGRFGLGLKLAGLSQCRLMTVASRHRSSDRIVAAQWDLDHVEATDRWEILRPPIRELDDQILDPLSQSSGTVVILDDLDRVMRFAYPDGSRAQGSFERAIDDVSRHLAMVFHRFLAGETQDGRRIDLVINGIPLEPWDPFCRSEPGTIALPTRGLSLGASTSLASREVQVRPYILPTEGAFSSSEAHEVAGGPRRWNRQQGLYLYRNDRLIQGGGWARLRTADEHTKLARIAVDFPAESDRDFGLNIAKSQVILPPAIRSGLSEIVASVTQLAQQAYRRPAGLQAEAARNRDPGVTSDPRSQALNKLVAMVIEACEQTIRDELGEDSLAAQRVGRPLREMADIFARDLEEVMVPRKATPSRTRPAPSS